MILSQYGYHGIRHLGAMLRDSYERSKDTEYIATILWSIGKLVGGDNYPMPSYDEFKHPKPKDNRTKKEIVDNLINKLRGGGEKKHDGTVQRSGEAGAG